MKNDSKVRKSCCPSESRGPVFDAADRMTKTMRTVFIPFGLMFFFSPLLVHGAFEDPLWSARVAALGGAATALNAGPVAAFYNPASVVAQENTEVEFTYAKLFAGLDNVNLSLSELSYLQTLPGDNVLTAGWGSVSASGLRREDTLAIGASHLFQDVKWIDKIAAGATFRYLSQSYTLDPRSAGDPVFQDGTSRSDVAIDLHAFVPEIPRVPSLKAGLSIRSLNQPDVGFSETDKLPLEVAVGAHYRWKNMAFPLDLVFRGGDATPQLGIEALFLKDRLALRGGTDTDQIGTGVGYSHELGAKRALVFDYTFLWPLNLQDTSGSHRATLGVRF